MLTVPAGNNLSDGNRKKNPQKSPEECFAEACVTDFKRTLEIWVSMQVISFCPSARIHSQNCDVAMAAHCTRGILTIYVSSTNLKTCPYRICVWVFCLFCYCFAVVFLIFVFCACVHSSAVNSSQRDLRAPGICMSSASVCGSRGTQFVFPGIRTSLGLQGTPHP